MSEATHMAEAHRSAKRVRVEAEGEADAEVSESEAGAGAEVVTTATAVLRTIVEDILGVSATAEMDHVVESSSVAVEDPRAQVAVRYARQQAACIRRFQNRVGREAAATTAATHTLTVLSGDVIPRTIRREARGSPRFLFAERMDPMVLYGETRAHSVRAGREDPVAAHLGALECGFGSGAAHVLGMTMLPLFTPDGRLDVSAVLLVWNTMYDCPHCVVALEAAFPDVDCARVHVSGVDADDTLEFHTGMCMMNLDKFCSGHYERVFCGALDDVMQDGDVTWRETPARATLTLQLASHAWQCPVTYITTYDEREGSGDGDGEDGEDDGDDDGDEDDTWSIVPLRQGGTFVNDYGGMPTLFVWCRPEGVFLPRPFHPDLGKGTWWPIRKYGPLLVKGLASATLCLLLGLAVEEAETPRSDADLFDVLEARAQVGITRMLALPAVVGLDLPGLKESVYQLPSPPPLPSSPSSPSHSPPGPPGPPSS